MQCPHGSAHFGKCGRYNMHTKDLHTLYSMHTVVTVIIVGKHAILNLTWDYLHSLSKLPETRLLLGK